MSGIPKQIEKSLHRELLEIDPSITPSDNLVDEMLQFVEHSGRKLVFIIDEYDAIVREEADDLEAQEAYFNLLRTWFENDNFVNKAVALVYMTGILPIKKENGQSVISGFEEFTMFDSRDLLEFTGYTEEEVRKLCVNHHMDFEEMKQMYDGYRYPEVGVLYNPYSVSEAIYHHNVESFWTQTCSYLFLEEYISMDFDGLGRCALELVAGYDIPIKTDDFANDFVTIRNKDDVLTLLALCGYLDYDSENSTVRIPNREIRKQFQSAIQHADGAEIQRHVSYSKKLFHDTYWKRDESVALQIKSFIMEQTLPFYIDDDDSLRYIIQMAYLLYFDDFDHWIELPSEKGCIDIAFLPKKNRPPHYNNPCLVVELKWNKDCESWIQRIRRGQYPESLQGKWEGIFLVELSYDKDMPIDNRTIVCKTEFIEEKIDTNCKE